MSIGYWWLSKTKNVSKIVIANGDTHSDLIITNIGPDEVDIFVGGINNGGVKGGGSIVIQANTIVEISLHASSEAAFGTIQK